MGQKSVSICLLCVGIVVIIMNMKVKKQGRSEAEPQLIFVH